MQKNWFVPTVVLILFCCTACNLNTPHGKPAYDSARIAKGALAFNQLCSGCHNFRQDGIGPHLGGITSRVPTAWIKLFIENPQRLIDSGDERASKLFSRYKTVMPAFPLSDDESEAIIAFLGTQTQPGQHLTTADSGNIVNPLPDTIERSGMVVSLELVTQVPVSSDSGKLPLARITKMDYQPGTGATFILDLRGKVYKLVGGKPSVYMDISVLRPAFIHQPGLGSGFGSFTFHPQFEMNGLLYTTHTEKRGTSKADFGYDDSINVTLQWVITEWQLDNPRAAVFSGKGRELFRLNTVTDQHGVQEITFNPLSQPGDEDYGLLYIGVGDGGSVENGYPFLAHDPGRVWGTILRIDPGGRNSRNGQYGIPPQNPFAGQSPGRLGEVFAYGFRNPHRINWTRAGQMLVSNIGHGHIESINLVVKGQDYGWPLREGNFLLHPKSDLNRVYPLPANDSNFGFSYPVAAYDHDEGKAISGGFEYTGSAVRGLKGKYVFGDIPTGRLFYIETRDIRPGSLARVREWQVALHGKPQSLSALCGSKRVDLHFGKDAHGELYIMTKADGRVYRLVGSR